MRHKVLLATSTTLDGLGPEIDRVCAVAINELKRDHRIDWCGSTFTMYEHIGHKASPWRCLILIPYVQYPKREPTSSLMMWLLSPLVLVPLIIGLFFLVHWL